MHVPVQVAILVACLCTFCLACGRDTGPGDGRHPETDVLEPSDAEDLGEHEDSTPNGEGDPGGDLDAVGGDVAVDRLVDPWEVPSDLPPGRLVTVRIDPARADGVLDPRYIGFALDTAQLTGGMWWQAGQLARVPAETPDLEDPKLVRLVSYLAPSLLRIGGTDCDAAYFCPEPGECELPETYRDVFIEENRLETVLVHEDVQRTADFAASVGAKVLFCVNLGPGPRDRQTGSWLPDNARQLIRFATSLDNGQVFAIWEPGNEIDSFSFNFHMPQPVTPDLFAQDLMAFRALVDEEDPGALVAAPGSYVSPFGEFQDFTPRLMAALARNGDEPLDALSWHLYATQSASCPFQVHPADGEHLFAEWMNDSHRAFARTMREAAGALPVWNTESASAQCGGQLGFSDTMMDALWYMDWLGLMAQEGTSLVIRHSLVGANYSLLEPHTFDPRPTFLALVLMRRMVGRSHLATEVDREAIKAHGWCGAGAEGGITAVLINPSTQTIVAEVTVDGVAVDSAERWVLDTGGDMAGKQAAINSVLVGPDGTIPEPAGLPALVAANRTWVEVPPAALVFVRLFTAEDIAGCR